MQIKWFAAALKKKKKKNLNIYKKEVAEEAHMAGNPCEELSPTGEKKKKKRRGKNRTRSYCTVLRQFKDQVQPAHKSQVL